MDEEGVCTPLFVLSKDLGNYHELCEWCYSKTEEYDKYLKLAEQGIFLLLQEYFISYNGLDASIYACFPTEANKETKKLHSYGQPKFWNGLYNEEWQGLYKKWLDMGGTPFLISVRKYMGSCGC